MTSDRIARDYLRSAQARRLAIEALLRAGAHPDVVREGQEVVELILKGALRFIGVDPPKRHDVHGVLRHFLDRLPSEWGDGLNEMEEALNRLVRERAPAFYGDEQESVPASDLFGDDDARRALGVVDRLLGMYERLLAREV